MRFYDIWYLLTFCGLAITFVNGLGVWSVDYMSSPDTTTFDVSDIESLSETEEVSAWDSAVLLVSQAVTAFCMIAQMALSAVYVYPVITETFGMPDLLAIFLQGGVVLAWVSFFIQVLLRFGFGQVES